MSSPIEIRKRLEIVMGGRGTTAKLSRATGVTQQQFRKIWSSKSGLPEWLVIITEFLEQVPQEDWPQRWRAL